MPSRRRARRSRSWNWRRRTFRGSRIARVARPKMRRWRSPSARRRRPCKASFRGTYAISARPRKPPRRKRKAPRVKNWPTAAQWERKSGRACARKSARRIIACGFSGSSRRRRERRFRTRSWRARAPAWAAGCAGSSRRRWWRRSDGPSAWASATTLKTKGSPTVGRRAARAMRAIWRCCAAFAAARAMPRAGSKRAMRRFSSANKTGPN